MRIQELGVIQWGICGDAGYQLKRGSYAKDAKEVHMPKTRSGSIRERPSSFYALVTYLDGRGNRQRNELKAASLKEARRLLKQTIQQLRNQGDATIIAQRVRERRGGVFARVTFTDESGSRREIERRAKNTTDAKDLIKGLLRDLDDHGEDLIDGAQMNFGQLADHFEENYLTKPNYIDGRKVTGLRSYYGLRIRLKMLKVYWRLNRAFGHRRKERRPALHYHRKQRTRATQARFQRRIEQRLDQAQSVL